MSKGSAPRPFKVSNQEYASRWDAIFGKDNAEKNKEKSDLESGQSNRSCSGGSIDHSKTHSGQTKND